MSTVETTADTASLRAGRAGRRGDAVFRGLTLAAGALVFVVLGAIAIFLVIKAIPSLRADTTSFWTTKTWSAAVGEASFGIAALLFGTVITSVLALVMAVPIGVGVAIYTTEYAPRRIATVLGYLTDMLAAVPSIVYGLWGLYLLLPHLTGLQVFLARYLGWIPLFSDPDGHAALFSKSIFGASIVLAIMILPIIAAVSREVLRQVDPAHKEAALALGATRWEMVRVAVLPPSRPGIISATMLGLGRALGETIAVALVIGDFFTINWHVLAPSGNTIAANIANLFGDADSIGRSALIASGLVLFVLTLAVNLAARYIILRSGTEERSAVG
ncbi:MAG TPA: phosphate ABC transporter permease subunit PstC [Mycobacteriales bacterium]|nr:phosphate ABC transporter permease subunit PstC [Mycobacteriales bacterium]